MSWITRILTSSIGKKMLMAASGAFLLLFILIHLVGNSTSLLGRAAFLSYAAHLHSLGPLVSLFEILLLGIFCTHVTLAVLLFLENRRARPQRYALVNSRGGRSPGSRTMIYSGTVILIFLVVHLLNYSVPIQSGPEVVPQRDVRVRVPLPDGASVAGVRCVAPEKDDLSPEFEVRDGACWFTVPEVTIYAVCRVALA